MKAVEGGRQALVSMWARLMVVLAVLRRQDCGPGGMLWWKRRMRVVPMRLSQVLKEGKPKCLERMRLKVLRTGWRLPERGYETAQAQAAPSTLTERSTSMERESTRVSS